MDTHARPNDKVTKRVYRANKTNTVHIHINGHHCFRFNELLPQNLKLNKEKDNQQIVADTDVDGTPELV